MSNEGKRCERCSVVCLCMANFCYDCGAPFPAPVRNISGSSESGSNEYDTPVEDPNRRTSQKARKRKRKPQHLSEVDAGRGEWTNPIRLGGWVVAVRVRGLRPDVDVEDITHLLDDVPAKCRVRVGPGKVASGGRIQQKCAEITCPIPDAANHAQAILESHPELSIHPATGLTIRIVRM